MKVNRRSVMSILAGAPIIGRQVGRDLARGGLSAGTEDSSAQAPGHPYPPGQPCAAIKQRMPRWSAARAVLGDKLVREQAESFLYFQHRDIGRIDPDIDVHRSFSLAAKIAYQRQRNVERMLSQMMDEPPDTLWDAVHSKINKLMYG